MVSAIGCYELMIAVTGLIPAQEKYQQKLRDDSWDSRACACAIKCEVIINDHYYYSLNLNVH